MEPLPVRPKLVKERVVGIGEYQREMKSIKFDG